MCTRESPTLTLGFLVVFNASSISVLSWNLVTEVEWEFVVVGGRGSFGWLEGFASSNDLQ